MRQLLNRQPRLAMSVKIALVVFAHGRVAASAGALGNAAIIPPQLPNLPPKEVVQEVLAQESEEAQEAGKEFLQTAAETLDQIADVAETSATKFNYFFQEPLSHDHLRIWLSSFNAGPYATLKYKGNVPYKETRNYTPKVLKYYQQDLSDSEYEPYIVASAKKYGLDVQMVRAIIKTESDFNKKCVSHAGARGLMQVMPAVWSEIKERYDLDWNYKGEVFDPAKNIEVACAYLAWLRYDFLPKRFDGFSPNPITPPDLVRDTRLKERVNKVVMETAKALPASNPVVDGVKVTLSKARAVTKGKSTSDKSDDNKPTKGAASKSVTKPTVTISAASKSSKKSKTSRSTSKKKTPSRSKS